MADILNLDKTPLYTTPGGTTYLVPGPGAEAIEQIINATWAEAQANKAEFATKLATALSGFLDTTNTPHITAGSVAIPAISEPAVSIPSAQSAGDVITEFGSQRLAIVAELIQKFSDFKVTYFPDEANAYIAAEDWLQAAIADPSGLPPAVVAQIFGDDQARILEDKSRAQDAVIAQFAGRRFPLLPDVAASITMQIEQKAQDELAESSRKVALLSVEMQKFNVEKLLGLRGMAMDSAIKYISALASAPDISSKLVGIGYDAQSKLISAAADFYRADAGAKEVVAKVAQFNTSTALEADVKNQMSNLTLIEDKLKALLAEAQALAQMSTSLFNNVHVSAGVSGGRNVSVGYSYSNDTSGVAPVTTDVA